MYTQENIRTLFFKEFVKRLIINSLPETQRIQKTDALFDKLEKTVVAPPIIKIERKIEEKPIEKTRVLYQPAPAAMQKPIIQKPIPVIQKLPETAGIPIMERISPILADPTVQSINCPGPDKNITVMRNGIIQIVAMSFNVLDIEAFLKDISEKTKIPLLPGLFKVVYQNLIITAVISEFVGTKFMIEKRIAPVLPPMPIKAQF